MRATIEPRHALQALRVLAPALSRSNPAVAPSCGLAAARDRLTLRATGLEWDVQHAIPAEVDEPGDAWIPAALARALPWGQLSPAITIQTAAGGLEIRAGSLGYTLPLVPPAAVSAISPGASPLAEAHGPTLASVLLLGASAARGTAAAPGDDGDRAAAGAADRDGVWVEISHALLRVSSTDRARVAAAAMSIANGCEAAAAVPTHAAVALARAAALADRVQLLRAADRRQSPVLTAAAGPAAVTVRTLAQLPPDPRGIAWDRQGQAVRCRAQGLRAALRAALAIAGTDPAAVAELRQHRGHLVIAAACHGSAATAAVELLHGQWGERPIPVPARDLLLAASVPGEAELELTLRGGTALQLASRCGEVDYRALVALRAPGAGRAAAQAAGAGTARG
jgi:hypothetical protein